MYSILIKGELINMKKLGYGVKMAFAPLPMGMVPISANLDFVCPIINQDPLVAQF
jgi:hypothetical protein